MSQKRGGQFRRGALAASRGADQRGHFALLGGESNVGQYILSVLIPEAHMVKANIVALWLDTLLYLAVRVLLNSFHTAEVGALR